jgi:hypothetical protein
MTGTKYSAEAVNTNLSFKRFCSMEFPSKEFKTKDETEFSMVGERSARSDATMKMLVDVAEVRMSA